MQSLEQCILSLDAITAGDINELRSYAMPPRQLQTVMEAVCILFNSPTHDWGTSKRYLSDRGFIARLKAYDRDHIPTATLQSLRRYIQDPNFTPEHLSRISTVAASICRWVRALYEYALMLPQSEGYRQQQQANPDVQVIRDQATNEQQQQPVQPQDLGTPTLVQVLEQAIGNLRTLSKADITELKSMRNPPPLVGTVMEAVSILLNSPKIDWEASRKILNDPNFLRNLVAFDRDNISPATIRNLRKYIDSAQFTREHVSRISMAAASLCGWVRAMYEYATVRQKIKAETQEHPEQAETLDSPQASQGDGAPQPSTPTHRPTSRGAEGASGPSGAAGHASTPTRPSSSSSARPSSSSSARPSSARPSSANTHSPSAANPNPKPWKPV
eukprot:TRINITY_DN1106_c0_g1_i2.p1 TRINITY_DN1106_c0_g1~~TRINITY_DN1106_c0_g1_i2.p1  ORF type:complete len:387 (-),score=70.17 TRINITY_DN1106_c0_g1_i2:128-1288(-)